MDDQRVEFEGVSDTFEVLIKTKDGTVPVQALSQGMTSLLSWVGILVQRLYEVNPTKPNPTHEAAIVLMDEMDAHMHPAWQQKLVYHLKRLFPQVQFIASTHSPLVAQDLSHLELHRLERAPNGTVRLVELDEESAGGRADQILTETGFGLMSALPYSLQKKMEEYEEMLGKPGEMRNTLEFLALQREIEDGVGPSAHTKLARRAQELADQVIETPKIEPKLRQLAESVIKVLEANPNV
jgi:hypothetical protein